MSISRAADEAAIQAVLVESYRAWEGGDANGMVANYTPDATAIMTGSLRESRDSVREGMALAFEGPLKGTSTYNKQLTLRFVGTDAAIVVSESGILFGGQTEVPDAGKVNATWVFEKRDGQWLIAAYHNSPVLAPGSDTFPATAVTERTSGRVPGIAARNTAPEPMGGHGTLPFQRTRDHRHVADRTAAIGQAGLGWILRWRWPVQLSSRVGRVASERMVPSPPPWSAARRLLGPW